MNIYSILASLVIVALSVPCVPNISLTPSVPVQSSTQNSPFVTIISDWPKNSTNFQPYVIEPVGNTVWIAATSVFNTPQGGKSQSQIINYTLGGTPKVIGTIKVPIIESLAYDQTRNRLWFLANQSLAYYNLTSKTTVYNVETSFASSSNPRYVVINPQTGQLWVTLTNADQIAMYDPANRQKPTLYDLPNKNSTVWGLAVAKDSTIWFAEASAKKIGHLVPCTPPAASCITEYSPPSSSTISLYAPVQITIGSDGIVWFTDHGSNQFGSFNPLTKEWKTFPIGYCFTDCASGLPNAISFDSHGKVWFSEHIAGRIAEYDPATLRLVEYIVHGPSGAYTWWAAPGENNLVWFASLGLSRIGYVNASIPVNLNVTGPGNITLQRGASQDVATKVAYSGNGNLSIAVSPTTPDFPGNGFANQLYSSAGPSETISGSASQMSRVPISSAWNATLGSRNVAITVSNGDVNVDILVQVTIVDSTVTYLTIGLVLVVAVGLAILVVKRPHKTHVAKTLTKKTTTTPQTSQERRRKK